MHPVRPMVHGVLQGVSDPKPLLLNAIRHRCTPGPECQNTECVVPHSLASSCDRASGCSVSVGHAGRHGTLPRPATHDIGWGSLPVSLSTLTNTSLGNLLPYCIASMNSDTQQTYTDIASTNSGTRRTYQYCSCVRWLSRQR